jgi:hypothetical protein
MLSCILTRYWEGGRRMLNKSTKFGTVLTVGPRLQKLLDAGVGLRLLWSEDYPDHEEATADGRGEFQRTREWIETASLEKVFDLWCRGNNLIGYAHTLLYATAEFRKVYKEK